MNITIKSQKNIAVAEISGEIDHHSAKELRTELDSYIITFQPELLIIDLSDVSFMDSSGVGLIIGRQKLIRQFGGNTEVKNPRPHIKRLLQLAGVEKTVRIKNKEE